MKKFHLIAIASGVILLAVLIYKIGPLAIWQRMVMLGWGFLLLVLLDGVTEVFHTIGWRCCLLGVHRSLSFAKVFAIRLAGSSINHLTPTAGFGGEVAKGVLLSTNRTGADAASAVIIDKLSQALGQIVFVVGSGIIISGRVALSGGLWAALIAGTALLTCGIIGFFVVQKYGKLGAVVRWAVAHRIGGAGLRTAALHATDVDQRLRAYYRLRPYDMPLSVMWHVAALTWSILPAYYFLAFVTGGASMPLATAIVCLGIWFNLVTFALPVDFGVQETTRRDRLHVLGFNSAAGLTYGITLRLEQLVWAGAGLAVYVVLVGGTAKRNGTLAGNGEAGVISSKGEDNKEVTWRRT